MKIRHLTINNFKGIDNLTIDFCDQFGQVRPVTVISGPNGSGKTSVLDAIWFGLLDVSRVDEPRSTFRAEPSIVVKSGAKFASVSFEMEISEEEKELINIWKNELIESKAIGNSPDIQSRHTGLYQKSLQWRLSDIGRFQYFERQQLRREFTPSKCYPGFQS
jgi:AAA15 family ATPase/GTPase